MKTSHQFLQMYPIDPRSKKLILGTIHPHDHHNFLVPFFYGNEGSIWKILSEAFPLELTQPVSLDGILNFLNARKIAISDTVIECTRLNPTALDKDLVPTKLNHELVEMIRNSDIDEILFTSGFKKNNAFKLFYENILGKKITPAIRKDRMIIDNESFGRAVKFTVLYSPSGSSNVPLSKNKLYLSSRDKYINSSRPVYDFKVDYYREKFS